MNHLALLEKILICLILTVFISGCMTQNEYGLNAYRKGDYELAAKFWIPEAKKGNSASQYNLGLLWEQGLGGLSANKSEASQWYLLSAKQGYVLAMVRLARLQWEAGLTSAAISWLNLAARWGNSDAINTLHKYGKPVPAPDLLAQKKHNDAIAKQETSEALSHALVGAISAYSSAKNATSSSAPTYSRSSTHECDSDYDCGIGFKCIKARYETTGSCMESVDKYGVQQNNMPESSSILMRKKSASDCMFDTDCPLEFHCDEEYEVCVKDNN